ncbi:hypothetical protein [Caldimonas brevitalea]|uniref:Membrane protein n=1 Tax=Caldimonas brevitalea TaxID=413882 RepID=A0A0G3BTA6_9BURK|nr:hypothetical protein [Caldimonas brevitalea]AKJ31248.1 membrane protein [Caldimonas brevitalea]
MQTIKGMLPHIIVIDMPHDIMRVIMSQHIDIISIGMPSLAIIVQRMPSSVISMRISGITGMPHTIIIGMPLQLIVQGMPRSAIEFIISQQSRIISIDMPSTGVIVQLKPSSVISQLMWLIIGLIMPIGIIIGMLAIGFISFIGICIDAFIRGSWELGLGTVEGQRNCD